MVPAKRRAGFQHTAARRRLGGYVNHPKDPGGVSTHSRPKAAGTRFDFRDEVSPRFNTQPPEGGWSNY